MLLECNVTKPIVVGSLEKALDTASKQYGETILKIHP